MGLPPTTSPQPQPPPPNTNGTGTPEDAPPTSASSSSPAIMSPAADLKALKKVDHRYLVVTRERFIVLDSGGDGVGAAAKVCSDNHLTELIKMTFRKKDPDLVNLFFLHMNAEDNLGVEQKDGQENSDTTQQQQQQQQTMTLKPQPFRIAKRKEFIEVLQKNMQRFK